ncbi:hypothetical protein P3T36_005422 [Kitasatospora sp. MAP12-15]|uniref:hypothetical protein n=1 Tax=unclassified Kitasatospora TaxID=2633591 RepID=UPI0024756050|nr:hypothetical protein [Kitasatospora sp. MAP12-44]MDH6109777.1 hypothetical protein [Kitasatospora sp. MAP12-44]
MSSPKRNTRRLALGVVALAFALTSCSYVAGKPSPGKPLIPPAQAGQRIDSLLDETTAAIQPPLKYWDESPQVDAAPSSGLSDHTQNWGSVTRSRHVMTKVAEAKYATLLDMLKRSWEAKGYKVTSTGPPQLAENASAPDGSGVGISFGGSGSIDISASVTPVPADQDPNAFGTASPEPTMSNGNPDVIPKYDDPFWSTG